MEPLMSTLSLEQLKQITKNTKSALKELGIDLTNSTTLNVVSKGFGFKDYNTAKAILSNHNTQSASIDDYPYGPFSFCTFLADPKKQDLFNLHLPLMKGVLLGADVDGVINEADAEKHGVIMGFNPTATLLDSQAVIQIIFDFIGHTTIVNIDAYQNQDDILKLIRTYRKYGIENLVLTSVRAASQGLQDECDRNMVQFRRERDIIFLSLVLRTETTNSERRNKMTHVPVKEFEVLAEKIGLSKQEAKHLARWYHKLNGGWIEYKLLIKGVMFAEEDTLLDIQRSLYEVFVYSIPDFNIGDKTKNEHWESYINKEGWKKNAEQMFIDGIYFNQEIADAIGLDYDIVSLMFATERNRYK